MKRPNIYGDFKTCYKCGDWGDLIDTCFKTQVPKHYCIECWCKRFLKTSCSGFAKQLFTKEQEEEKEWLDTPINQPKIDYEYQGGKAYRTMLSFFREDFLKRKEKT